MWKCDRCEHVAPESFPGVMPVELHGSDVAPWPDCDDQTVSLVMEETDSKPIEREEIELEDLNGIANVVVRSLSQDS